MVTRVSRIAFFLFICIIIVTHYAWAQDRDVTIVYSNNVNGQVYPAG